MTENEILKEREEHDNKNRIPGKVYASRIPGMFHCDGYDVGIDKKDFWDYILSKGLSREKISGLSFKLKNEFFLKWKHGLSDAHANEEIEATKQMLYHRDKNIPLENVPIGWREWIKKEREFETYCMSIKSQIGIFEKSKPKEIEDVAKELGVEVVGYGSPIS